jgi:2-succinyl-5-enolpyruvyl-6-hydroxy-3-cyclohexene-1-carboxylate synthase
MRSALHDMAGDAGERDDAHLNGQWARLIFGTLVSAGLSDVFISPGSRSTPLAWQALRTAGLRCHPVVDERCAAFAALGFARATGRPAALLCTSGSAAAHYLPAIVEAALAYLPLLAITVDRPFDVQHSGTAQSIDQMKLYGDQVRRYFELGLPDRTQGGLIGLRRAVTQAVAISLAPLPGPVHLNVRARKPLEPVGAATAAQAALEERVDSLLATPVTRHVPLAANPCMLAVRDLARALVTARAGALILGPMPPQDAALADCMGRLASEIGFPIMAEATSQMRFALCGHALACPEFGWLLASPPFRHAHEPDVLLYFGTSPTSAELERWARESRSGRYIVCDYGSPDPLGDARMMLHGGAVLTLPALLHEVTALASPPSPPQRAFAAAFIAAAKRCRAIVADESARESGLAEGAAVACIAQRLPHGAQWVLGNSLPIRDVDAYVPVAARLRVLSQRGANGIDGLVSGAAGSALAVNAPTLLLVGDVSLMHDLGGLAIAREVQGPFVIAVLDNGGGRIFDQLPVRELYATEPATQRFWRTEPGGDLAHAAPLFGIRYAAATTLDELSAATEDALQTNGVTLLHARVTPDSARVVRERVLARLAAAAA